MNEVNVWYSVLKSICNWEKLSSSTDSHWLFRLLTPPPMCNPSSLAPPLRSGSKSACVGGVNSQSVTSATSECTIIFDPSGARNTFSHTMIRSEFTPFGVTSLLWYSGCLSLYVHHVHTNSPVCIHYLCPLQTRWILHPVGSFMSLRSL